MEFEHEKRYEFDLSNARKLVVILQKLDDREFIDVRQWIKFRNQDEYSPHYKGITLTKKVWRDVVIPQLIELCGA